ncbi:hypothetical protein Fmac_018813 [Flemingia macrophylla]|uniref:Alkaline/neutral invertase n=1 Tax=Flemingia macrophylla TaxID=520843 RepID=A0ABD1M6E4_9FABA
MLTAYAQNGQIKNARKVFDEMPHQTTVSYNAMIAAYIRNGCNVGKAYELFSVLAECNLVSYAAMITGFVKAGKFHMADGYLKMGEVDEVLRVFENMTERDMVSWSAMVDGLCRDGRVAAARDLFDRMPERSVEGLLILQPSVEIIVLSLITQLVVAQSEQHVQSEPRSGSDIQEVKEVPLNVRKCNMRSGDKMAFSLLKEFYRYILDIVVVAVLLWLLTAASIKARRPHIAKRALDIAHYYDGTLGCYIGKQARSVKEIRDLICGDGKVELKSVPAKLLQNEQETKEEGTTC